MFTRLSVHWALSTTATSNWNVLSKCNSVSTLGISRRKYSNMRR